MEPAVLGGKLASSLIAPLVKRLFVADGPGAGLVDKPVRLSSLVSFKGEKRRLDGKDVHRLAQHFVQQAMDSPGEHPFRSAEQTAVADALARRLLALGDLDMDDIQAVRLGHRELARQLKHRAPAPDGLSTDAGHFLDSATEWACLQILEFFTRRSTFVARTLVEQTRTQSELIARVDELIARTPRPGTHDRAFERRYLPYVAERHNHITIYGIDLRDSPDRWPLEVAYLSLEATATEDRRLPDEHPGAALTVQLPAEDALSTHDRVLLRGDAGSGKTTLVQWLAVTTARDGDRIPYVLPLRTLIRAGQLPSPTDFLTAVGCPHTAPDGWTERVLTAGRALILVDGLDEIPAADRHRTRDWLQSLISAFPGNRWLLTSRPTAVRPDWLSPEGFRELTLAPMRRPEVKTFVERWHAAADAPEYEGPLLDSLRTKRDLARLATNPLMCGLICALHRERRGYLPTGRKELYDAALTMLLARRDRERGMGALEGAELGEEAQLEILQRLAYALVLSGRTEMDVETAEGIVERCLPTVAGQGDARTVLRDLLLRSGLLRQPADGVVDFVHRTFQDYLGARYAVEEGHLDVLISRAGDTQWEDVIRMAVAHARPRERVVLLRQLLARDEPRLTLLALACLEHATALDPRVRAEVEERAAALIPPRTREDAHALAGAGPLVLELLPGPEGLTDEEARAVTITASVLGTAEPDGALAVLRRFRDHRSLDVRRQLAGTWDRFDTREYAVEVLDHLPRDDLFVVCSSPEQLAALRLMSPWHMLTIDGSYRLGEIIDAIGDPDAVNILMLEDNSVVDTLDELLPFRSLSGLWLRSCYEVRDLDRLSELPLTSLTFNHVADPSGLRALDGLIQLSLDQSFPEGRRLPDYLPTDAALELLDLGWRTLSSTGLRGLECWPTVTTLRLNAPSTPLGARDWQEVNRLPALRALVLNGNLDGYAVEVMPELPSVQLLRLPDQPRNQDQLSKLASRLPSLRTLTVDTYSGVSTSLDLYAEIFRTAEVTDDRL
ncbi:NACHT domain-containing protein [Streptomyces sp. MBT65]|uniref:NACHT domain-containing protein n=1 Tax=Streptomyces sp. MBT65 TaxID=1488395 RepID=UPI00190E048E|nr:NACHT domain-containing protein [Streptomyces sp. MBT65]MBK3575076.1 NACHT domain-containing protein [Streptomyces sp. MBT65]